MTKRELKAKIRREEDMAVAMYIKGRTLKEIKQRTGVAGFIVRGLVMAHTLRHTSR